MMNKLTLSIWPLLLVTVVISNSTISAKDVAQLEMVPGLHTPYYHSHDWQSPDQNVRVAVLFIHGTKRDSENYFDRVVHAAEVAGAAEKTVILVPQFSIEEEAAANQLFWSQAGWKQGDLAQNARKEFKISSFDVVDELLSKLTTSKAFPNLERISVIGHSAGGQFVNRYVCAADLAKAHGIQVQFVIMNPSTYLYLDGQRFCDGQCLNESDLKEVAPEYNNYRYGLEGLNTKMNQIGKDAIAERMVTRRCYYFGGTADTLEAYLDVTLPAMQQGVNRYERFKNYRAYVESFHDKRWKQNSSFREIPHVGHSSADTMASPVISEVLFR